MKAKIYKFPPTHRPWNSYEDVPAGTVEWAERVSASLQIHSRHRDATSKHYLPKTIKAILKAKPAPWEIYPPDNPFGTPDVYCAAITGHSWEALLALVVDLDPDDERLMKVALAEAQAKSSSAGRPKLNTNSTHLREQSPTSQERLLRRLAREAPEILERYEAGEFASVAAAARAAGIKVGQSPLQKLRSAWKAATLEEREIFAEEVLNA